MCGIIGYTGYGDASDIITDGLHLLEYRGYDSAGMTICTDRGLMTLKTEGRVSELEKKVKSKQFKNAFCGIGHTRWATHGEPSEKNAHPHGTGNVMLVHNGIIENCAELRQMLKKHGYRFDSDTDTQAAAYMLDLEYKEEKDPIKAIADLIKHLKGSYAFGIIFADEPDTIYSVKKDSPLLIGIGENENFIASDISAFINHTKKYIRLCDGEIAKITKSDIEVYGTGGENLFKDIETADIGAVELEKKGFEHYMLKEIYEQPEAVRKTIRFLSNGNMPDTRYFKDIGVFHITACGTAMHAGLIGKYFIENFARVPVYTELAGEFRYKNPILSKNDIVALISQSGETADTLAALRLVNSRNIKTLSIVNTEGSAIARESDNVIYTKAGTEIAVASTKAFTVQVAAMLLTALKTAEAKGKMTKDETDSIIGYIYNNIERSLLSVFHSDTIEKASEIISARHDAFFIGRGYDNYLGMEGSLKLKEISYIHSEAYAAGELKHGTISLIEKGTPVIAIATDELYYDKIKNNIEEVKSRGGYIISVCPENAEKIKEVSDTAILIPNDDKPLRPFSAAAAIQLLAYHTAKKLGKDIDKPRNLAKSVTVE